MCTCGRNLPGPHAITPSQHFMPQIPGVIRQVSGEPEFPPTPSLSNFTAAV